jgi:hypothetical protein
MALNSNVHSDQEENPIMAVRPLPLAMTEQIPSRRYGKARSSQTKHNCFICDKPVDINASNEEAAGKAMHGECYVLREMLMQWTSPLNCPRA